jgi:putative acetyltransferase
MRTEIRKITPKDNATMAGIIREVMPEFGANGPGFAIHDPEVDDLCTAFSNDKSAYYVCVVNGMIIGGAGIAPLKGGDTDTCELQKMYLLPSSRGKGYGRTLLDICLKTARELGYRRCYIETFSTMNTAIGLYERTGFARIDGPMGSTGHFACNTFYMLDL